MKKIRLLALLFLFISAPGLRAQCSGDFTWLVNGLNVSFFGTISPGITTISWTFGDASGDNSNSLFVQHTYAQPGTYEACIVYSDNLGCTDSTCHIIALDSCYGAFTYTVNGLTVVFDGTASGAGPNAVHVWNFGDNSPGSSQEDPTYTYASAGNYTVCYTFNDISTGCQDSVCMPIAVGVVCTSDFIFTNSAGNNAQFYSTSSGYDPNNVVFVWTFSDGGSSNQQNPNYTFTGTGPFQACLAIADTLGGVCDTHCDSIPDSTAAVCQASFSWIDSLGYVFFINTSTYGNSGSYIWDFGDGNWDYTFSPAHQYTTQGIYMVCLIAMDSMQNYCDSSCQNVTVPPSIGMGETVLANSWTLSPNPASGFFEIAWVMGQEGKVSISVYDIYGRHLRQLTNQDFAAGPQKIGMNTDEFAGGTYFIRASTPLYTTSKRLVINRGP